jgi:hypothetical protein
VYSEPRDNRPWIAPDIPADATTVRFTDRLWREIEIA